MSASDTPTALLSRRAAIGLGGGGLIFASACKGPGLLGQGQNASDTLTSVLTKRRVRVGYVVLAPWASKDPRTNALSGSFIELCDAVFKPVSVKVEYVETQWSTFVAGIQSGQFDLSIVPSYPTPQRAAAVAFTDEISTLANSALVRSTDNRFKTVFDLNRQGVRLVAIEGEQSAEFIRNRLPLASLRTFGSGDFALLYSEVLAGRADAAFGYVDSIRSFANAHPEVRDIAPGVPYSTLPICWATPYASDHVREFLNSSLKYLRGNGSMASIERKYAAS